VGGGRRCCAGAAPIYCSSLGCALGMAARAGWRNAQLAVLHQMLQCNLH